LHLLRLRISQVQHKYLLEADEPFHFAFGGNVYTEEEHMMTYLVRSASLAVGLGMQFLLVAVLFGV
jgi:hypothetical protein